MQTSDDIRVAKFDQNVGSWSTTKIEYRVNLVIILVTLVLLPYLMYVVLVLILLLLLIRERFVASIFGCSYLFFSR